MENRSGPFLAAESATLTDMKECPQVPLVVCEVLGSCAGPQSPAGPWTTQWRGGRGATTPVEGESRTLGCRGRWETLCIVKKELVVVRRLRRQVNMFVRVM